MSTYLQRLLDRAAPPPAAAVLPAGLSQYPVSLADQRLNDPDFADYYTPSPNAERVLGQFGALALDRPRSAPRRPPTPPASESDLSGTAPTDSEPVAPPVPTDISNAPPTESPPPVAAPQHPQPAGHVATDELLLPEPDPILHETNEATPPPAEPVQPVPPEAQSSQPEPTPLQTAPPEATLRPEAQDAFAEAEPDPPRPRPDQIPVALPPEVLVPEEAANSPIATEPPSPAEVMPPPIVTPDLPDPPVPKLHQPNPAPAPTPAPKAPEQQPQAPAPLQERRTRPMTAAEASIIGQLTRRRRALTIFGLRRR